MHTLRPALVAPAVLEDSNVLEHSSRSSPHVVNIFILHILKDEFCEDTYMFKTNCVIFMQVYKSPSPLYSQSGGDYGIIHNGVP